MQAEPLELLKAARSQISGEQEEQYYDPAQEAEKQKLQNEQILKQQVDSSDQRHLEALQNEMIDIRRQKLFNDLIRRIQEGEDISVEEFQELTHEQRDVLKAHNEAAQKRKANEQNQQSGLVEPPSKRNRRLGGQRKAAEKQQTRVEKPVPPSG